MHDVSEWNSFYNKIEKQRELSRLRYRHTNIIRIHLMQRQANPSKCERCRKHVKVKDNIVDCIKIAATHNYYNGPTC